MTTQLYFSTCTLDGSAPRETSLEVPYSDEMFALPAAEYHDDIALLTAVLSASAYSRTENSTHEGYAAGNLRELGFTATSYNYALPIAADRDLVAYTFGMKRIDNCDAYFIIVRGTPDSSEWAGNFDFGDSRRDTHQNLELAAKELVSRFQEFVVANATSAETMRIIVTGHSRGGGVAELVGRELDNVANLTVYAFAPSAPVRNVVNGDVRYPNIHPVINPNDFAPKFPLERWGYCHLGNAHMLPETLSDAVHDQFERINGAPLLVAETDGETLAEGLRRSFEVASTPDEYYHRQDKWWDGSIMTPYRFTQAFMGVQFGLPVPPAVTAVAEYQADYPAYAQLAAFFAGPGFNFYEHTITTYISALLAEQTVTN